MLKHVLRQRAGVSHFLAQAAMEGVAQAPVCGLHPRPRLPKCRPHNGERSAHLLAARRCRRRSRLVRGQLQRQLVARQRGALQAAQVAQAMPDTQ